MAMQIFTGQCDNYYVTGPIVKTFEVLPHGCVGTAVWDLLYQTVFSPMGVGECLIPLVTMHA